MSLLTVEHLRKVYTTRFGGNSVEALRDVNFTVERGEYTAIMGESGSGKTTLLNILAALDKPTSGTVLLEGKNLANIKVNTKAAHRAARPLRFRSVKLPVLSSFYRAVNGRNGNMQVKCQLKNILP